MMKTSLSHMRSGDLIAGFGFDVYLPFFFFYQEIEQILTLLLIEHLLRAGCILGTLYRSSH